MPPIFKALTTITAWTLFILGWLFLLGTNIGSAVGGVFSGAEPPLCFFLGNGVGIASLILSVCAMKLRQTLE